MVGLAINRGPSIIKLLKLGREKFLAGLRILDLQGIGEHRALRQLFGELDEAMHDFRNRSREPDRGPDLLQHLPVLLAFESTGAGDDHMVEYAAERFEDFALDRPEGLNPVLSEYLRYASPGFFRDALIDVDKTEAEDFRELIGDRGLTARGGSDYNEVGIFLAIERLGIWQVVHNVQTKNIAVSRGEEICYLGLQKLMIARLLPECFYHSAGKSGKGIMHIQTESKDSVLIWQINRPDRRNALGPILAEELWAKVSELGNLLPTWPEASPKPRILAIKALSDMGDRQAIWIAGGDLKELSQLKDRAEGRKYAETMAKVCLALQKLPIPVVALIDGLVIGGGVEFALAADLRFATKRSIFHFKQLELGLSTAYASAGRLTHLIGAARAMNYLLRSSKLTAQKAYEAGLITEVVDDASGLDKELFRLASDVGRLNPRSVAAQKHLLNLHSTNDKTAAELDTFEELWMNDYHQESLKRFLNPKAKPKGSGE